MKAPPPEIIGSAFLNAPSPKSYVTSPAYAVKNCQLVKDKSFRCELTNHGKEVLQVEVEWMPLLDPPPCISASVTLTVLPNVLGNAPSCTDDGEDIRSAFGGARASYEARSRCEPRKFPVFTAADWMAIEAALRKAGAFDV